MCRRNGSCGRHRRLQDDGNRRLSAEERRRRNQITGPEAQADFAARMRGQIPGTINPTPPSVGNNNNTINTSQAGNVHGPIASTSSGDSAHLPRIPKISAPSIPGSQGAQSSTLLPPSNNPSSSSSSYSAQNRLQRTKEKMKEKQQAEVQRQKDKEAKILAQRQQQAARAANSAQGSDIRQRDPRHQLGHNPTASGNPSAAKGASNARREDRANSGVDIRPRYPPPSSTITSGDAAAAASTSTAP